MAQEACGLSCSGVPGPGCLLWSRLGPTALRGQHLSNGAWDSGSFLVSSWSRGHGTCRVTQKWPALEIPRQGRATSDGLLGRTGPVTTSSSRLMGRRALLGWLGPEAGRQRWAMPVLNKPESWVYSGCPWRCQTLQQTPSPGMGIEEEDPGPCLPSLLAGPASPTALRPA